MVAIFKFKIRFKNVFFSNHLYFIKIYRNEFFFQNVLPYCFKIICFCRTFFIVFIDIYEKLSVLVLKMI